MLHLADRMFCAGNLGHRVMEPALLSWHKFKATVLGLWNSLSHLLLRLNLRPRVITAQLQPVWVTMAALEGRLSRRQPRRSHLHCETLLETIFDASCHAILFRANHQRSRIDVDTQANGSRPIHLARGLRCAESELDTLKLVRLVVS